MNLKRQLCVRIDQFEKKRKSLRVRNVFAKNVGAMFCPEIVQRATAQGPEVHHALCFRPIDDFPRFANARCWWQAPAELRLKSAPAPDAFHKKRFEGEGTGEIVLGHSTISGTVAAAVPAALFSYCRRHACHYKQR